MNRAGRCTRTVLVAVVLLCMPVVSDAQDGPTAGALDGRLFADLIGPEGALALEGELHFNEGMMWSRRCDSLPAPRAR